MRGKEGIGPCVLQQRVLTERLGATEKSSDCYQNLPYFISHLPAASFRKWHWWHRRWRAKSYPGFSGESLCLCTVRHLGEVAHALTEVLSGGTSALAAPPIEMTCVRPP